jgi:hypothetical protein
MYKNFLVTDIEWDTEAEPQEDCGLPSQVLVVNIPQEVWSNEDELDNQLSELTSDCFGFCHRGFDSCDFNTLELKPNGTLHDMKSCIAIVNFTIYAGLS